MCNFHVDVAAWEARFGRRFADEYAAELAELAAPDGPEAHGFVRVSPAAIEVTPTGTLFVRNLAMAFDRHLRGRRADRPTFSRTV